MDVLSVSKGPLRIFISTHHHEIHFSTCNGLEPVALHEFTFDQLFQLLGELKPGIAKLMDTPPKTSRQRVKKCS